jgi:hypothetical protein
MCIWVLVIVDGVYRPWWRDQRQVNPVLTAVEGQVVQLTQINGEGAEHDSLVSMRRRVFRAVQWSGLSSSRVCYPKLARNDTARSARACPTWFRSGADLFTWWACRDPAMSQPWPWARFWASRAAHQRLLGRDCGPKLRLKPADAQDHATLTAAWHCCGFRRERHR